MDDLQTPVRRPAPRPAGVVTEEQPGTPEKLAEAGAPALSSGGALGGLGTEPHLSASPAKGTPRRRGDVVFAGSTRASSVLVFVVIIAIGVFLVTRAVPSLGKNNASFLFSTVFDPENAKPVFGVLALAFGTVVTAALALLIAAPVAIGIALYVTQYAPPRIARPVGYLVDLLAAVPSVIFGLWGRSFLDGHLHGTREFLHSYLGWTTLFGNPDNGADFFLVALILAVMILPIIAALSREVFVQVPQANREAALGLGATRWEMIRMAVLPFSKAGVVSAVMLGLGRALGETIAVALVLSYSTKITSDLLGPGATIAGTIAIKFGDYSEIGRGALIAAGLVLFVIVLLVNMAARTIVTRGAKKLAA